MRLGSYKIKLEMVSGEPKLTLSEDVPGAVPGSTPGVLDPVPVMYPVGPTDLGFLYQQLGKVAFSGTANSFTVPQTFAVGAQADGVGAVNLTLTDTGGGADTGNVLRPALLTLQHNTTAATVPGVGGALYFQGKDTAGTVVRIGKEVHEFTDPAAGAVFSNMAWCVQSAGTEVEVFRLRGGGGMAPTFFPGGSLADGGGASGKCGGQFWARGDLLTSGFVTHQNTDAVNNGVLRSIAFEHLLSAGSVAPGFGTEHFWQTRDASNNLIAAARNQMFLTGAVAGNVASVLAWSIVYNGSETEVFRARPVGMLPTTPAGIVPNTGGQFWVRGDFFHSGTSLGFYNATPVTKPTVSGAKAGNAALTSLIAALVSQGLFIDTTT